MNIALIIDRYLPQKGGGERYVQILARGLVARGHQVTIFARRFPDETSPAPEIRFHRISTPRWPGFLKVRAFAHRCEQEIRKGNYDIVHDVGHMVGADIFNPHGGVEQVWLRRYFASYDNPFHRVFKRVQRLISPKEWALLSLQKRQYLSQETHRIIAISPMIREHIRMYYPHIPLNKIALVQNPADLSRFSPKNRDTFREPEREKLGFKDDDIVLLFVGNNFRLKGLHPLLKAFKVLANGFPRLYLLVAGNESPRRWQRLCRKMEINHRVLFHGPTESIEHLYAAADIFVLPTYYDSAPLVVLEALASGLPVITSRWAGTSSAVTNPNTGAILQNNDDPEEIAKAIRSFFPYEKRQNALSASPRSVRSWSINGHVEHVLEIYHEVMREKSHG